MIIDCTRRKDFYINSEAELDEILAMNDICPLSTATLVINPDVGSIQVYTLYVDADGTFYWA